MEYLNRVELKGIVGDVRVTDVGENSRMANFTITTNYAYRKNGQIQVETTQHSIVATEDKDFPRFDLAHLSKGEKVHIFGRIKMEKYLNSEGVYEISPRIVANHISKVQDDDND